MEGKGETPMKCQSILTILVVLLVIGMMVVAVNPVAVDPVAADGVSLARGPGGEIDNG